MVLSVFAHALFAFGDVQGANGKIDALRTQYPASPFATAILPLLQLVAMAEADSAKMNAAIAEMQSAGFSPDAMHQAFSMKRGYLRYHPTPRIPKIAVRPAASAGPEKPSFVLDAYPNPFNSSVTFEFEIESDARVQLRLYDMLGACIAVPLDDYRCAGRHIFVYTPDQRVRPSLFLAVLSDGTNMAMTRLLFTR